MADLLDDYTKATFPLEVKWGNSGTIRLLAAFQNRVVGVSFGTFERDGETVEYLNQVLDWDGQGKFGQLGQSYPDMDLPPPPARAAEFISVMKDEIADAQGRLDAMPDAPESWRSIDERKIKYLRDQIASIGESFQ